jgi:glycosyltransferase involved in cell wall biosynthesis
MNQLSRLLVIIPDYLSHLVQKGEITDRYYNPKNLFRDVHIVMTNDDSPNANELQPTVGTAKLYLYNIPAGKRLFVSSLGWRPWLLGRWADQLVHLAEVVKPQLVRCHGAHLNAFAAHRIKAKLGIPYVVSLHINPDVDMRGRATTWREHLVTRAQHQVERVSLQNADLVMPVYRPILPYLERLGIRHYEVCYNVLNPEHLLRKDNYMLHDPVRLISVGRQFREKNPENLIRAVAEIRGTHLTIVGDGPYHDRLKEVARQKLVTERVEFIPALPNDELCRRLPDFDIFAVHTEYWELSKSVLEPLLTGLPVIINRRRGPEVPELTKEICLLVENTVHGYRSAIECLIGDHNVRERLGRAAYAHAQANWAPARTEEKVCEIYRRFALPD